MMTTANTTLLLLVLDGIVDLPVRRGRWLLVIVVERGLVLVVIFIKLDTGHIV